MATKYLESGTAATQGFEFYASTTGTVSSVATPAFTDSRSIEQDTSSPAASANVASATGVLADTGRRVAYAFRYDQTPAATNVIGLGAVTSGGTTVFNIRVTTGNKININPVGATAVDGTYVMTVNTWYHICVSYYITNSTTWKIVAYLHDANGTLLNTITAQTGTLTTTATSFLRLGVGISLGANHKAWFSDAYCDDGASSASQPDTGLIRVTAKRPFANGTTNGFTATGTPSGYGSGNAQYVNELPLSTTNYVSVVTVATPITEEYNIETPSDGDVNLNGATLVDYVGWIYYKTVLSETASIVVNGVNTAFVSTANTDTMLTQPANSTSYPAGTGTDIGMITSNTATTVTLYECGLLVAYKPVPTGVNIFPGIGF